MLTRSAVVCLVITLVCAAPAPAQQDKNNDKFLTGDVWLGWVETLRPPDIMCAGGAPTGDVYPPYCTPETKRIVGRNELQVWMAYYPDPSVAAFVGGEIQFVVNCTMNSAYRGPCWGTFRWELPGGARWEGSWTSPVMDLVTFESRMAMVGFGTGGAIDGKHLMFDGGSNPGDWFITGKVRIR